MLVLHSITIDTDDEHDHDDDDDHHHMIRRVEYCNFHDDVTEQNNKQNTQKKTKDDNAEKTSITGVMVSTWKNRRPLPISYS